MAASTAPTLLLSDYLEGLSGTTFRKLYQQPSATLAVFRRMLPKLAQVFVGAMLYRPTPMLLAELESWVKPDAQSKKCVHLSPSAEPAAARRGLRSD
jgi:transcription initiation factor TFIIH subunit 4